MPFTHAIKLPVYIYSHTQFQCLSGKVEFIDKIHRGMVRIGVRGDRGQGATIIRNFGTIKFGDSVKIFQGCDIYCSVSAIMEIGRNSLIKENVIIYATRKIIIGERARIAFQTNIYDSDFHYMLNMDNGEIHKNKSEVIIGRNNWIGIRTIIKKGTVTPDNLIIASAHSMLNKDYTSLPQYSIIGGSPAKLLVSNRRRVFSIASERHVTNHYAHSNELYVFNMNNDPDEFCFRP